MEKLVGILEDFQSNKITVEEYFQKTEQYSTEEISQGLKILNKKTKQNGGSK